jgi:tetratricopeptide (TPR) repeat protein
MSFRILLILTLLFVPCVVQAEGEGQADLDKAMELKLSANSLKDLGEVINLCRNALSAGLDDANKEFAEKMLMGTLVQRGQIMCEQIFDQAEPPDQWPMMRRQAILDLEEAARIDSKQFDVHYMIGRLNALPGGDRVRARKALDDAILLAGNSPNDQAKAYLLRANLTEDSATRVADYNKAVELAPKDPEMVRTRGLYFLMEKKLPEALADIDKAIELEPDHSDSYEARGVIQFLDNKNDDAQKSFERAIELQPKSAMAHTHLARVYAVKDDDEKAMSELDKALKIDPKLAVALVLRARLHQQKGNLDAALDDVDESLRVAPGNAQGLQLRAMLHAGSGKVADAINDLLDLRRNDPNNIELLMQLGVFYSVDKRPDRAIETFNSVLKRDPENAGALRYRGDAYLSLGKVDDALADYESALKVNKEDSGVLNNLAWLLATSTQEKLRDGKRSLELAKEAARVTEFKEAHILSTLAAAYAENGDFETAKKWSQKAVELAGESPEGKTVQDQLKQELTSYEANKPWREEAKTQAPSNDPEPEELPEPPKKPEAETKAKEL